MIKVYGMFYFSGQLTDAVDMGNFPSVEMAVNYAQIQKANDKKRDVETMSTSDFRYKVVTDYGMSNEREFYV